MLACTSEMGSGGSSVGRSTHFTHDCHVDDENTERHDDVQQEQVDVDDGDRCVHISLKPDDVFDGLSSDRDEQQCCDDLLRLLGREVQLRLIIL